MATEEFKPRHITELAGFGTAYVSDGDYQLYESEYHYGGKALVITQGAVEVVMKVSVHLDTPPAEGCMWVKTWAENAGVLHELISRGILEETGRTERTGFVTAVEARLTERWAHA